ncbi:sensor histidine kinase [Nonomuraea helvata]|uniref:histidine kinase n=1 Tax=Nonomuraea helvata TaxID=37484 RepID=A0ABV5S7N1_9ACTN
MGILVSASIIAAETFLGYFLSRHIPASTMGPVYVLGVLAVSFLCGPVLGVLTAVASGVILDYFLLPPADAFSVWGWIPLVIFLTVALLVGWGAALMRSLAVETEERRSDADLDAQIARLLLRTEHLRSALPVAAQQLGRALGLPFLSIETATVAGDGQHVALPLTVSGNRLGTLTVPKDLPERMTRRLDERVVPSLEALLHAAHEREAISQALEASRDELRRFAEEQAALRRVATLVAHGVRPSEIFDAVTGEVGHIVNADFALLERYDPGPTVVLVSVWAKDGCAQMPTAGSNWPLEKHSIASLVTCAGHPERIDIDENIAGQLADWSRAIGVVSAVGIPITVEGQPWGVMIALFRALEAAEQSVEERMLDFTELVATALANAQARNELAASRARVVAASDEARRQIECDLHDGAEQRLMEVGLALRTVADLVPEDLVELRERLEHIGEGTALVIQELRTLSPGIHPAVLSKSGLGPALTMLARHSVVPVELVLAVECRLPERIEAVIYDIVFEALTNVAKHARASIVCVELDMKDTKVRVAVRDDGIGGAVLTDGAGLVALNDRVLALGGTFEIDSPARQGTLLTAVIPSGR